MPPGQPRKLDPRKTVSVVVACYNETAVLPALVERLTAAAAGWPCAMEAVLVDDGSTDGTWEATEEIDGRDPRRELPG